MGTGQRPDLHRTTETIGAKKMKCYKEARNSPARTAQAVLQRARTGQTVLPRHTQGRSIQKGVGFKAWRERRKEKQKRKRDSETNKKLVKSTVSRLPQKEEEKPSEGKKNKVKTGKASEKTEWR